MFNSHGGGLARLIAWLWASVAHDTVVTAELPAGACAESFVETGFP